MPEFIGRPNLPNALAQSLVQMAAHQNDPIAEAIKTLGSEIGSGLHRGAEKEKEHAHQVELKKMELDAKNKDRGHDLLLELIKSGQATPSANRPMNSEDAARLLDPNFQGPLQSSGKRMPPPEGSFASENYPGQKLPGGYDIKPKKTATAQSYALTKEMIAKAPSLGALPLGTDIPHKDYLDAVELEKTKKGSASDKDMDLAARMVEKSKDGPMMSPDQLAEATLKMESKIKAHRRGEKVTFEDVVPPAEGAKESWADYFGKKFHSIVGSTDKGSKDDKSGASKSSASLPGLKITKKKA